MGAGPARWRRRADDVLKHVQAEAGAGGEAAAMATAVRSDRLGANLGQAGLARKAGLRVRLELDYQGSKVRPCGAVPSLARLE